MRAYAAMRRRVTCVGAVLAGLAWVLPAVAEAQSAATPIRPPSNAPLEPGGVSKNGQSWLHGRRLFVRAPGGFRAVRLEIPEPVLEPAGPGPGWVLRAPEFSSSMSHMKSRMQQVCSDQGEAIGVNDLGMVSPMSCLNSESASSGFISETMQQVREINSCIEDFSSNGSCEICVGWVSAALKVVIGVAAG